MLSYFRINDPYRLITLLVILILLYLPDFIAPPPITYTELKSIILGQSLMDGHIPYKQLVTSIPPLTCWLYGVIDLLFGEAIFPRHLVSFLIIYFQCVYIGIMFNNRKVFSENTYIPSVIFGLLFFFSYDNIVLSGELLGSLFLLFTIGNLFKEVEFRIRRIETMLYLGVLVGIATTFHFPYIVFLPLVSFVAVLYSRRDLRGFMLLITGFLLPHGIYVTLYYLTGHAADLWDMYYLSNLSWGEDALMGGRGLLVICSVPIFYLIVSLFILNRGARFTKYQSQLFQIMFLWMVFSIPLYFISGDFRPQSLIVAIPPTTFFFTHFILLIRRRKFAVMNFWILFLGLVTVHFLSRYGLIDQVDYSTIQVQSVAKENQKPKRILVLDKDYGLYQGNKLATGFFEWNLTKTIFEKSDRYENVIRIYDQFIKDPPKAIYDPHNLMPGVFERIPKLRNQYKQKDQWLIKEQLLD